MRQREDLWIWSSRESQDCTPHLLTLRRDGETCFWPLPENANCQRREETVTITLGTQTLTLSSGRNQQRREVPGSHSAEGCRRVQKVCTPCTSQVTHSCPSAFPEVRAQIGSFLGVLLQPLCCSPPPSQAQSKS